MRTAPSVRRPDDYKARRVTPARARFPRQVISDTFQRAAKPYCGCFRCGGEIPKGSRYRKVMTGIAVSYGRKGAVFPRAVEQMLECEACCTWDARRYDIVTAIRKVEKRVSL